MKAVSMVLVVAVMLTAANAGVVAPDVKVEKLAATFAFTEGPASDSKGNVYFTDQPNDKIYVWTTDGKLSVFLDGAERSNGLYFDADGVSLLACADLHRRIVSFDPNGKITVLADKYNGKELNSTNDLWRDPKGGIYFTDPLYPRKWWSDSNLKQEGQHTYYLTPDRKTVIRVSEDLTQPNGIIGTPDGKLLYIADIGAKKTYAYTINPDGTLSNKKLFCELGSDGMTIDNEGNVYLTGKGVSVFNPAGEKIEQIDINEPWTANVTFGGKDQDTLFITASKSLYAVKMRTKGTTWLVTEKKSVIAPDAKIQKLSGGFKFTEGPIADKQGNVFFTDIPNNQIKKWSVDGTLTTFLENSGGANGLDIDDKGNLYTCQGSDRKIARISTDGKVAILCDNYKGKKLNSPNDLWRDKKGGIYFTDPGYGNRREMEQAGDYVFYLPPDTNQPIIVIEDMNRPNGIVGSPDGKTLYVTDMQGSKTWVFKINPDGTLSDRKLFVKMGSDGMTLDEQGNLYLTGRSVTVFDPSGEKIDYINMGNTTTSNVCFGGPDGKTLFITAGSSLFSIKMDVKGQ